MVSNESFVQLTIYGKEDQSTVSYSDIKAVKLTKSSGIVPAHCTIVISTKSKKFGDSILLNNKMELTAGMTEATAKKYKLEVVEKPNQKYNNSSQLYEVTIKAMIENGFRFCSERRCFAAQGSAVEALESTIKMWSEGKTSENGPFSKLTQNTMEDSLKFTFSNPDKIKSTEPKTTNWRCYFKSHNNFLAHIWRHMDIAQNNGNYKLKDKDFPLMYIDFDNKIVLRSFNSIMAKQPSLTFSPTGKSSNKKGKTIQYVGVFTPQSYKTYTNMYSGFGQCTGINHLQNGKTQVIYTKGKPLVAATTQDETSGQGVTKMNNKEQSMNVPTTFTTAFYHNITHIVNLGAYAGDLKCIGVIDVNPLDLINVVGANDSDDGKYIVDEVEYAFGYNTMPQTRIYVIRDNVNNVENNVKKKESVVEILVDKIQSLCSYIAVIRQTLAIVGKAMDGTLVKSIYGGLTSLKYNFLTMASVNYQKLDGNTFAGIMDGALGMSNQAVNAIVNTFIPVPYNKVFQNILLRGNDTIWTLLGQAVTSYVPMELQSSVMDLLTAFGGLKDTLSSTLIQNTLALQSSNISNNGYNYVSTVITDTNAGVTAIATSTKEATLSTSQNSIKVDKIATDILEKVDGSSIPIPNIILSDEEALLPESEVRELIVDKTVDNLIDSGYLDGYNKFEDGSEYKNKFNSQEEYGEYIKNIIINKEDNKDVKLDLEIINNIMDTRGYLLYTRYWGVINSYKDLVDYYISNQYRDTFTTIPTTKIIKTSRGQQLFVAFPETVDTLGMEIYVNNKLMNIGGDFVCINCGTFDPSKKVDREYKAIGEDTASIRLNSDGKNIMLSDSSKGYLSNISEYDYEKIYKGAFPINEFPAFMCENAYLVADSAGTFSGMTFEKGDRIFSNGRAWVKYAKGTYLPNEDCDMRKYQVKMGYNQYNRPIYYNVYYTDVKGGYNSNSTVLEVRRKI